MSESCQHYPVLLAKLHNMELDHDLCYAASKSRDPRFDGRFFVAVLTTGIYCRPICPVPMPKRENVRFYLSAPAAREAGFRPCLRCRPEASPGTPEWQGPSAIVSRGLHLIDEGVMEEGGIDELAKRLNLGRRQIRRLFEKHLGASPIQVAQTRRLHFAKKLINETNLPMTQIAFASGFTSVRRFNDVLRKTYDRTPTELRYQKKGKRISVDHGFLNLSLAYRPPFNWQALLQFLEARRLPGVEQIDGDTYRRTVQFGTENGVISISPIEHHYQLRLSVPPNLSRHLLSISERIRSMFDLRADPMPIAEILTGDPQLRPLVTANPGLRVPGAWSAFELGVRAILGQQVSIQAANSFAGRIAESYGEPLSDSEWPGLAYVFPGPTQLEEASLQEIGLTGKRAETIRHFAQAALDDSALLQTGRSLEAVIERLKRIPGIGPWTAHYIATRGLGEPDAFPAGDLGLQRAAARKGQPRLTETELRSRSQAWRPWRAYAAITLWRHYASSKPGGFLI